MPDMPHDHNQNIEHHPELVPDAKDPQGRKGSLLQGRGYGRCTTDASYNRACGENRMPR